MSFGFLRPFLFLLILLTPCAVRAQVTDDQLLHASGDPKDWLTYSGSYMSQRFCNSK